MARRQLRAIGMSASTIGDWINAGHLHPIHRGVYTVGLPSLSQEGRWMAAVLACGDEAVLSHGPSGQLQGLIPKRERLALHVSLSDRTRRKPAGIVVHRPRSLEEHDRAIHLWIPTTTPTRTVWDLASTAPSLQTRRAFEQAEKKHMLNRSRLSTLLRASPSRKGATTIRQLLADRPLPLSETRSWLEELLLTICRHHSLPLPAVNVPLLDYQVDFLWPRARFVVEADGSDHLTSRQRDKDNERDIALARAGYLVRRYSSRAMSREEAVAREVLEILAERLRNPA